MTTDIKKTDFLFWVFLLAGLVLPSNSAETVLAKIGTGENPVIATEVASDGKIYVVGSNGTSVSGSIGNLPPSITQEDGTFVIDLDLEPHDGGTPQTILDLGGGSNGVTVSYYSGNRIRVHFRFSNTSKVEEIAVDRFGRRRLLIPLQFWAGYLVNHGRFADAPVKTSPGLLNGATSWAQANDGSAIGKTVDTNSAREQQRPFASGRIWDASFFGGVGLPEGSGTLRPPNGALKVYDSDGVEFPELAHNLIPFLPTSISVSDDSAVYLAGQREIAKIVGDKIIARWSPDRSAPNGTPQRTDQAHDDLRERSSYWTITDLKTRDDIVFIVGRFHGKIPFGNEDLDATSYLDNCGNFLAKLDSDLNLLTFRKWGLGNGIDDSIATEFDYDPDDPNPTEPRLNLAVDDADEWRLVAPNGGKSDENTTFQWIDDLSEANGNTPIDRDPEAGPDKLYWNNDRLIAIWWDQRFGEGNDPRFRQDFTLNAATRVRSTSPLTEYKVDLNYKARRDGGGDWEGDNGTRTPGYEDSESWTNYFREVTLETTLQQYVQSGYFSIPENSLSLARIPRPKLAVVDGAVYVASEWERGPFDIVRNLFAVGILDRIKNDDPVVSLGFRRGNGNRVAGLPVRIRRSWNDIVRESDLGIQEPADDVSGGRGYFVRFDEETLIPRAVSSGLTIHNNPIAHLSVVDNQLYGATSGSEVSTVEIFRMNLNGLEIQNRATLSTDAPQRVESMSVADGSQGVFLLGQWNTGAVSLGNASGSGFTPEELLSTGGPALYYAKLSPELEWQWANRLNQLELNQGGELLSSSLRWNPATGQSVFTGAFRDGQLDFLDAEEDGTKIISPPDSPKGYFFKVDSDGNLVEDIFLEVVSDYGTKNEKFPYLGLQQGVQGESYTVNVPEHVFVDANGESLDDDEEGITSRSLTRHTVTGYTVTYPNDPGVQGFTGTNFSVTIDLQRDTVVTFHWRTDHAVIIASDLRGTGASFEYREGGEDEWVPNANGDWTGEGLTNPNAGNPDPPVNKHWIEEGTLFTSFVAEVVPDSEDSQTRYAIESYTLDGSAEDYEEGAKIPNIFDDTQTVQWGEPNPVGRLQVPRFAVLGPAIITYNWKVQHGLTLATSGAASDGLVAVQEEGAELKTGSGTYWFDRGSNVQVGARDGEGSGRTRESILSRIGVFEGEVFPGTEGIPAHDYFGYNFENLSQGGRITWGYGDPVYRRVVDIGQSVRSSAAADTDSDFFEATNHLPMEVNDRPIATAPPPAVGTIFADPTGGGPDGLIVWDPVAGKVYPIRPGHFQLDWQTAEGSVRLEVISRFAGDALNDSSAYLNDGQVSAIGFKDGANLADGERQRDYLCLTHEEMPPIDLDPSPDDDAFFQQLAFSESAKPLVAVDSSITVTDVAHHNQRHVLVFTKSLTQSAARGAVTEPATVKVVETKNWNDDSVSAEGNPEPAIIGQRLSSVHDRAGLGTGFLVYDDLARFNPNIYDRSKIAEAGPIIAVNRQFTDRVEDDLTVIWYDRADDIGGVLWPRTLATHAAQWPTTSLYSFNPEDESQIQPLDRIVIASRLGSEGKNGWVKGPDGIRTGEPFHNDQFVFDPARYSEVSIYNQPDPKMPGYNPNEEHALIAPSFKFLDSPNPPPVAYALRNDLNVTEGAGYTSEPYVLVQFFDNVEQEWKMEVYDVELEDDSFSLDVPDKYDPNPEVDGDEREFPYVFTYKMRAGEPVQPPYPLGNVIGLTPCEWSFGRNGWADNETNRTYWEDHKGTAWAVSGGTPGTGDPENGGTAAVPGRLRSYFYYPMQVEFWFEDAEGTEIPPGACIRFLPDQAPHTEFGHAPDASFRDDDPREIRYAATWPDEVPILKAGETLTYAGGEYKADNPAAPGLPGVIGWAAGEIVFDSLNPSADPTTASSQYSGRLIEPLLERRVRLTTDPGELAIPSFNPVQIAAGDLEALREELSPARGRTEVSGLVWQFADLPASLKKRIFFDPLTNELGLRGFVNDRTLGDNDLTASPPPAYVLEPNILTRREKDTLDDLLPESISGWQSAVDALFLLSRDPAKLEEDGVESPAYNVGLRREWQRNRDGEIVYEMDDTDPTGFKRDAFGNRIPSTSDEGSPLTGTENKNALGPGLALIPSAQFLDPTATDPVTGEPLTSGYLTLVENNDPRLGGPVSVFIIKIDKQHRYRGSIKTILAENVFEEKITLRHTGDFGANSDDIVYQWFYREEDGTERPLPPGQPWKIFPDQGPNVIKGSGMHGIDVEGTGGLALADNLFFVRYRHRIDVPDGEEADSFNGVNWSGTEWADNGRDFIDPADPNFPRDETDGLIPQFGGEWAGAANSPTVDGAYRPQLVQGWIKRVTDRINPYEARFDDFRSNDVPATYVSMIRQAGAPYVGPVALNPDKDVIENVGLLELYHTVLDRGRGLSIDLSSPITSPGITNALLLASSKLSDLYMLLGNEAYGDALDPTIGFGSNSVEYGHASPTIFAFQNQMGSLLDEELSLLRGVDDSFGRPVFNRLFWNFTKNEGEVAYALNYKITDQNEDGFIDEADAMLDYPQGHGDAWGHYLSASRQHYDLMRHPFFNWVSRSEQYNLLDVVIDVDFEDERKFADAAAAKARTGAEIVQQTYRSRFVADPDGQWQGYTDPDEDRAWGVEGWARRAGQAAVFDWVTANAVLPAEDTKNAGLVNEALKKIDRGTVVAIQEISAEHNRIQSYYDDANGGTNPLGLSPDVVPFDVNPQQVNRVFLSAGGHFDQIHARAVKAAKNALTVFDHANANGNRVRKGQVKTDDFQVQSRQEDRALRNQLIGIFGTPYRGTIGPGKPYPPGYSGPDLMLFQYVDVNEIDASGLHGSRQNLEGSQPTLQVNFQGLYDEIVAVNGGRFVSEGYPYFVDDLFVTEGDDGILQSNLDDVIGLTPIEADGNLILNVPLTAGDYTFVAPPDWDFRDSPGELQALIAQMLRQEATVAEALSDYDNHVKEIVDLSEHLRTRSITLGEGLAAVELQRLITESTNLGILAAEGVASLLRRQTKAVDETIREQIDSFPEDFSTFGTPVRPNFVIPLSKPSKVVKEGFETAARGFDLFIRLAEYSKTIVGFGFQIDALDRSGTAEIRGIMKEIEKHLRNELGARLDVYKKLESLRELSDKYRTTLVKGQALLDKREAFNRKTAAVTQQVRYQDMAFRLFRNEALQKYRDSFDLAARYTYMAAKAYDYETNLDPNDPASATALVDDIVRARHLGTWSGGEPIAGTGGLADALAIMRDNFAVLKGQLGLNNPQVDNASKISLREGHFRIPAGSQSLEADDHNEVWRQVLDDSWKGNLWNIPEFRRYCRPPRAESEGNLPGLVIDFPTEIVFQKNLFGWPLGGGDFSFDPTNFATKIRSVGVWFEGYDHSQLALAPRVYLIPAGTDRMTVPNSAGLKVRDWNVVDQAIPVPFTTGTSDLQDPGWIPLLDGLDAPLTEVRQFSSFRAYGDQSGSPPTEDEMTFDTRLVGRSAWNTRWLLIIPTGTLGADEAQAFEDFKASVTDIKLFFQTYGYSGN